MQSLNVSLQWEVAPEGQKRGRGCSNGEKTSSVPEDLDIIEEEESEKSPTIHGASYRKLRLLSTGSDDSGIAIDDADFEERDTDHEMDFCDGKLELWQDRRRRQGLRSALFWRCSNEDCDGKRTDFPSSDKNGRFLWFLHT